ncbi:unnamed protein product [Trichogramma brassicae]|uniref:Uncharacterized protein n=1 Tax=Trichogramma brassicae TaxID=86971 RepID=A0A6H5IGP0_9HYME|nr:unnamed protein product [Trichogramma brassicae]
MRRCVVRILIELIEQRIRVIRYRRVYRRASIAINNTGASTTSCILSIRSLRRARNSRLQKRIRGIDLNRGESSTRGTAGHYTPLIYRFFPKHKTVFCVSFRDSRYNFSRCSRRQLFVYTVSLVLSLCAVCFRHHYHPSLSSMLPSLDLGLKNCHLDLHCDSSATGRFSLSPLDARGVNTDPAKDFPRRSRDAMTPLSPRVAYSVHQKSRCNDSIVSPGGLLCAPGMNTDQATTFSEEVEMLWLLCSPGVLLGAPGVNIDPATTFSEGVKLCSLLRPPGWPTLCTRYEYRPGDDFLRGSRDVMATMFPGCPTRCTRCEYRPDDNFLRGSRDVMATMLPGCPTRLTRCEYRPDDDFLRGSRDVMATMFPGCPTRCTRCEYRPADDFLHEKFRCYHYIIPRVTCTIPQVRIPTGDDLNRGSQSF